MAFSPNVREMNVLEQGGRAFLPPCNWNDVVHLSANSAASYSLTTLRSTASLKAGQPVFLVFSADGPFWANFNGTASVPSGSNTDGSAAEFSPNQRYCASDITAISFISPQAVNICVSAYIP